MRTAPDYIQLYPTLRCNRSCDFCFNQSVPFAPDMSLQDCRTMFGRLKAAGVKTIDIIGGEPTMHPEIVQIIREAGAQGFSVNISSNGSNLESLEEILKANDNITVGISINDRETFEHCSIFIKKRGLVVKSVFSLAMDETLLHDILALNPKKFYLIYRDAVDGTEIHAAMPFHRFMEAVQKRFPSANVGTVFCSGFIPDVKNYPELAAVRCPAGTTKLGIMPDGGVYPCNLFFGNKDLLLGNILTDQLDAIWNNPALEFFRSYSGNRCPQKACELHPQCHGGCPAQSLLLSGDLDAPDPRCTLDTLHDPDRSTHITTLGGRTRFRS